MTELQKSDHFDPRNREERQQKLILAMMQEDELQKLFYYADMLQVSEPTVSKDLESLEEWFQRQNILLLRRAGFGVGLVYKEEDYRKALLAYASKYQDQSFIETDIYDKIKYFVKATGKDIIDKLTGYSVKNFLLYTAISIQRIKQHKYISELLGKGTIEKKSSGETRGRQGSSSRNYDLLGRELMTPDEARKFDNKKCLIYIRITESQ